MTGKYIVEASRTHGRIVHRTTHDTLADAEATYYTLLDEGLEVTIYQVVRSTEG